MTGQNSWPITRTVVAYEWLAKVTCALTLIRLLVYATFCKSHVTHLELEVETQKFQNTLWM